MPAPNPTVRTCRCFYCQQLVVYDTTVPLRGENVAGVGTLHSHRVCENCMPQTTPCCQCGFHTMGSRGYQLEERQYCEFCFTSVALLCRECGAGFRLSEDEYHREEQYNHRLCDHCINNMYCRCSNCNRLIHIDDAVSSGDEDFLDPVYHCSRCHRQRSRDSQISKTFEKNRHQRTVGYEIEFYAPNRNLDEIQTRLSSFGEFHADGSIRPAVGGGLEFASFPSNGDKLLENILTVCNRIRAGGAGVNSSCGLHIHLSVERNTDQERTNLRDWWCVFEPIFFSIVSPSRRNNDYAQSVQGLLNEYDRDNDNEDDPREDDEDRRPGWASNRYVAFNICAYNEHGTYEVRLHQGTLNPEKIISWVMLLLEFFETFSQLRMTYARRLEVNSMSSRELMIFFFKQMSLPMKIRKYVMSRYREFNNRLDGNAPYILLNKRRV